MAFLVFPVAAVDVMIDSNVVRTVVVIAAVTGPRNMLKAALKHAAIQEESIKKVSTREKFQRAVRKVMLRPSCQHTDWTQVVKSTRCANAVWWESAFFASAMAFVLVICSVSINIIHQHQRPLWRTVLCNCDGLGFAFVLELVFGLLIPAKGFRDGKRHWGFFARWWSGAEYTRTPQSEFGCGAVSLVSCPDSQAASTMPVFSGEATSAVPTEDGTNQSR